MTSPWADYSAGFELRSYQKAALDRFESVRAAGKRQFYLVAPPGSGKTLLGLSMAASLGEPAVVLSPTTTIAEQWLGRLREHWVCLDSALERFEPNPVATSEPSADRFALGSLTYQRLSVPGTEQELHENVRRLHATLEAAGVGTLILDECHHLSRAWGVAVKELIRALGAPFVIGLTATPIHVAAGPLVELTRAPDHAISLPSVVRNGDLAPYQELCHTVAPSTEEQSLIDASLGSFEALFEECCRASPDRFSLLHWLEELVSDPSVDAAHRSDRLLELSDSERDLVVALCRLRNERGGEPPEVLPYAPEFDDPTELGDRLLLVAHYTAQVLLREPALASGELAVRARAILSDWGYLVVEQRVSEKLGDVSEIVGFSRQKLEGAAAILRTELRHTGEELRVLIVTDFEFPPEGSRALSCLEVMDPLTRDPGLDELNPILVTGSSLLVDDDLWPHFRELAEEWAGKQGVELELEENRERGFVRVGAAGGKLDTPASVRLATELLERGQSRCIIGTRALLGEGWDCRRLNTLIDLTVVTSGVSVNQLRGRSLRLDQENPGKVANHWDVLCLSAVGDRTDLERIVRRHDQLYGVTDDGQVERGVGHFHASFSHRDPAELYAKRAEVNQAMHDRAATRAETRARWRVGEPCRDEEWSVFGFTAAGAGVRARGATADVARESALLLSPSGLSEARLALVKKALSGLAGSAAMIAITAATSGGVLWGAASIPTLAGLLWALRSRLPNVGERGLAAELQLLAEILVEAEGGGAMTPRISERADGTLRLVWEGTEASRAARFSTAMAELLGPVSAQRYLLRESLREVPPSIFGLLFGNVTHTERVFPVPRMFGRRSAAERLLEVWRTRRHPDAALIHTKEDAERSVLVRFRGVRPIAGRSTLDVIWR